MKIPGNLVNVLTARAFLSFSYGFLNIILSIYLHSLGYPLLEIGLILGSAILISAILTFLLSLLADHYGRKFLLVILFILFAASSALFLYTRNVVVLAILSGLGGFTGSGGGPIGSGGPFGSVQTALITEVSERKNFSRILSYASIIGMLAASAGSFTLEGLEIWRVGVYQLFYLAALLGLVGAIISMFLKDNGIRSKHLLPRISWKNIIKLSIPTIPNGVGIGFVAPIFSLWFKLKFGISTGEIGVIYGISNLFVILTMFILPRLVKPESELTAIISTRIVSAFALLAMAISPFLWSTALLYVLRSRMQMGAVPLRQSFSMGIVHESERATTSGTSSMVRTGVSSVSPPISTPLLSMNIDYPPLIGGLLTFLDPLLYYVLFRKNFEGARKNA